MDDNTVGRQKIHSFLPFNQGSNGAGNDGGKGNPANPDGYPTSYFWEYVFQKDSMMDINPKVYSSAGKGRKETNA